LGFLDKIFQSVGGDFSTPSRERTESVQKVIVALKDREPNESAYLAGFAFLLSRVAHADGEISGQERKKIEDIVTKTGNLSAADSKLIAEIVANQTIIFGATENYLVAREFKETSSYQQRLELMECLFQVAAVDSSVSKEEEAELKLLAQELMVKDYDFTAIRSRFNEHRDVLKF
jgi:uncharacterized tellurite resistance protein B-like protein